jgi:hypothetical protein
LISPWLSAEPPRHRQAPPIHDDPASIASSRIESGFDRVSGTKLKKARTTPAQASPAVERFPPRCLEIPDQIDVASVPADSTGPISVFLLVCAGIYAILNRMRQTFGG